MVRKTIYAVQPFESTARGRSKVLPAMEVPSSTAALMRAERLAEQRGGAIAFSRQIDAEFGEYEEPVVLGRFGDVPREFEH